MRVRFPPCHCLQDSHFKNKGKDLCHGFQTLESEKSRKQDVGQDYFAWVSSSLRRKVLIIILDSSQGNCLFQIRQQLRRPFEKFKVLRQKELLYQTHLCSLCLSWEKSLAFVLPGWLIFQKHKITWRIEVETGPEGRNRCYFQETTGVTNISRRQWEHSEILLTSSEYPQR